MDKLLLGPANNPFYTNSKRLEKFTTKAEKQLQSDCFEVVDKKGIFLLIENDILQKEHILDLVIDI